MIRHVHSNFYNIFQFYGKIKTYTSRTISCKRLISHSPRNKPWRRKGSSYPAMGRRRFTTSVPRMSSPSRSAGQIDNGRSSSLFIAFRDATPIRAGFNVSICKTTVPAIRPLFMNVWIKTMNRLLPPFRRFIILQLLEAI